jgi:hypothetical protein
MATADFGVIASEFHRRVAKTIWCTLATVDTLDRARTRIVHPVWDGPEGWLGARAATPKLTHVTRRPDVSLLYWDPDHEQVTIDARASIASTPEARRRAWDALRAPAPPYGFDPALIWPGGPDGDGFVAVRLVARRIELFGTPPVVWKAPPSPDPSSEVPEVRT